MAETVTNNTSATTSGATRPQINAPQLPTNITSAPKQPSAQQVAERVYQLMMEDARRARERLGGE